MVEELRADTDEVLVVTNTPELFASLDLRMVPDALPDQGCRISLGSVLQFLALQRGENKMIDCIPRPGGFVQLGKLGTARFHIGPMA